MVRLQAEHFGGGGFVAPGLAHCLFENLFLDVADGLFEIVGVNRALNAGIAAAPETFRSEENRRGRETRALR